MVGLTLILCLLFAILTILLVYIIEDQVFVNQIKAEQLAFEQILLAQPQREDKWQPLNTNIKRIDNAKGLPDSLPESTLMTILENQGIHEYFDNDNAMFIASLKTPRTDTPYYLVYDVSGLLAVRKSKSSLFILIGLLTLIISLVAVLLARQLSKATLAPVRRLSQALQGNDLDDVVIKLANEFSEDEIGVLARELALSLERVKQSAQREYDFNRAVSHELRSPIQIAQSATELLQLLIVEQDSKTHKLLSRLQRSVAEMNEVAEAFLWLASDRVVDATEKCSAITLKNTIISLRELYPNYEISINGLDSELINYPLPTNILSIVLRSLIRNAVTHGDGTEINIIFSVENIIVVNAVDSVARQTESFGIGLNIVQRICDRFNFHLKADTDDENLYRCSINFNEKT